MYVLCTLRSGRWKESHFRSGLANSFVNFIIIKDLIYLITNTKIAQDVGARLPILHHGHAQFQPHADAQHALHF